MIAKYPSLLRRYLATVLDGVVVIAIVISIARLLKEQGYNDGALGLLVICPLFIYEPVLTGKAATLGQLVFRFRVRDFYDQTKPIGVLRGYRRWITKMSLGVFSLLAIPSDTHRRAIHDKGASSIALNLTN